MASEPALPSVGLSAEATTEGSRVAELLRDAIRRGLLSPGTALVQRDLAAKLKISRIPVRDALRILTAEGLVTETGGRTAVTALSVDQIDELYSLRLLVEPALAEAIVENQTEHEHHALLALAARMDQQEIAGDAQAWSTANFRFHDGLYASAARPYHHRIAQQLLTLVESYSRTAVFHLGGWQASQAEHHLMLQAIAAQKPDDLRGLLQQHLERARHDLVTFTASLATRERESRADRAAARASELASLIREGG
jgi:GntR family transcriptional regulator of gluconate operon